MNGVVGECGRSGGTWPRLAADGADADAADGSAAARPSYNASTLRRLRSLCTALRQTECRLADLKADIETRLTHTQPAASLCAVSSERSDNDRLSDARRWQMSRLVAARSRLLLASELSRQRTDHITHFTEQLSTMARRIDRQTALVRTTRSRLCDVDSLLSARRRRLMSDLWRTMPMEELCNADALPSLFCACFQAPAYTEAGGGGGGGPAASRPAVEYWTILGMHLPAGDAVDGHSDMETNGSLERATLLVHTAAKCLCVPLRYPICLRMINGVQRLCLVDCVDAGAANGHSVCPVSVLATGAAWETDARDYAFYLLSRNVQDIRVAVCHMWPQLRWSLPLPGSLRVLLRNLHEVFTAVAAGGGRPTSAAPCSTAAVAAPLPLATVAPSASAVHTRTDGERDRTSCISQPHL